MKQEEEAEVEVIEEIEVIEVEEIEVEEIEGEEQEVIGGIEDKEVIIMMNLSWDQSITMRKSQYLLLNPSLLIQRTMEWVSLEEDEEEGSKTLIDSQLWAKINKLTKQ